ncbi:Anoctamin [Fasciola gigantica]|uniref:Anoctamin n=1 Tax=Fasciola gigantica TaxID=46835 RepID=A0A504Z406_FASGI|nr:Anoctamin [Fasciola gigantica]
MPRTLVFYHVLAMKFIFVFLFETIAVLLTSVIAALIPDTPKHIKTQICREAHVTNQIILHAELQHQTQRPSNRRGAFRSRQSRGLQDPVLRDVFDRLAETDAVKQPSTALPVIGFYSFEDEPSPVTSVSRLPEPGTRTTEQDENMPLIGFRVPSNCQ